ncbi:hypothetical protein [Pandoraea pneumonica]|uniref:hypothetical protein n=1 Tax=Pandoraea pneumonica TaxID=2508299 RepID=UPI001242F285|nr:hypothetical protein [Pandoraea pneumonica]
MTNAELVVEVIKTSPATAVPVMTLLGYSMVAGWVSMATLAYVVMLAAHYIYKNFIKPSRNPE